MIRLRSANEGIKTPYSARSTSRQSRFMKTEGHIKSTDELETVKELKRDSRQKRVGSNSSKRDFRRSHGGSSTEQLGVKLENFKMYLHKDSMGDPSVLQTQNSQAMLRSGLYNGAEHEIMKQRLQRKIQMAHQKLSEMKTKVRHYQLEKQQILRNNDMRRSMTPNRPYTPFEGK